MAEVAEVQVIDINTFSHGTDSYPGITEIRYTKNTGKIIPIRFEGDLIGAKVERVADDSRFPVEFTISSKSQAVLLQLVDATAGDATFKGREAGTANKGTWTLTGAIYETSDATAQVSQPGEFTIKGYATAIAYAQDVA